MTARTTRRQLFGAPAAMLLLAAPAAGAGKAQELDAELLAACARFTWLEDEYERLCRLTDWRLDHVSTPADEALSEEFQAVADEQLEIGDWLAETTPRTPEGLQAKARAVLTYLDSNEEGQDMISRLQLALVRDVAGRMGA